MKGVLLSRRVESTKQLLIAGVPNASYLSRRWPAVLDVSVSKLCRSNYTFT